MELQVISATVAEAIFKDLSGVGVCPTNKVLVASIDAEQRTVSGIIIPQGDKDGLAKRGVLVQTGVITEEYQEYSSILSTGVIAYYGEYGGKEIENLNNYITSVTVPKGLKLRVLSITEIMYIQNNN